MSELVEAVRSLRIAFPDLGLKSFVSKLREERPDLGAGTKEVRSTLMLLAEQAMVSEGKTQEDEMKIGNWVFVNSLVKCPELNGLMGKVIAEVDDSQRVGVVILGKEYKIKKTNLSAKKEKFMVVKPHRSRLDLVRSVCKIRSEQVVVVRSGEIIGGGLETREIPWYDDLPVIYNMEKAYGAPVLPSSECENGGWLGGGKMDLRDLSYLSAEEREKVIEAAFTEEGCAVLSFDLSETGPKPWTEALSGCLMDYMDAVKMEDKDAQLSCMYRDVCDHVKKDFGADVIERAAHCFADGCIPRFFFGLPHLMFTKPEISDLVKCELRDSSIGGINGLGCFLRAGCSAKPGELLSLYPFAMIGKYYRKELEGDVELDHHVLADLHEYPEWLNMGTTDPKRLMRMAKRYSVQLAPAPGCALFGSHPPVSKEAFDPAWIAHMVNSTKDGYPVANATLVPNLMGGLWWGVAAKDDIGPREEVVVNYGAGWFEAHPDHDLDK